MSSGRNSLLEIDAERTRKAKEEARKFDRELMVPKAAQMAFGKSPEALRKAIHADNVEVVCDLWATERSVPLIRLSSALKFWGSPDPQVLEAMRENGEVFGLNGLAYNVLLHRPFLTLREAQELESDD